METIIRLAHQFWFVPFVVGAVMVPLARAALRAWDKENTARLDLWEEALNIDPKLPAPQQSFAWGYYLIGTFAAQCFVVGFGALLILFTS